MTEPILTREHVLRIVRKTLKENNDRDKLSSNAFVKLYEAFHDAQEQEIERRWKEATKRFARYDAFDMARKAIEKDMQGFLERMKRSEEKRNG